MIDKELKNLITSWCNSPEGVACRGNFELKKAPKLVEILRNSPQKSRLLELATDCCNESLRKDSGMFFTPGAVAEAMFRKSLELWEKTHPSLEELENITVLDPACGSGEFLLAALDVLLERYRKRFPEQSISELSAKIIQNNLYGIDCNQNSIALLLDHFDILANQTANRKHFIVADALSKSNGGSFFDRPEKFDIVIGNPPYVSYGLRNVGKLTSEYASELKKRFPDSAEYKIALYTLFMEFAINSTAHNGVQCFIVPDSFLCGQYYSKIRNFMLKSCVLSQLMFVKTKLFRATPGALVIYFAIHRQAEEGDCVETLLVEKDFPTYPFNKGYLMPQRQFLENFRQRFRLFFDRQTHCRISAIEKASICTLGDILTLASGIVAKHGKNSIISCKECDGNFKRCLTNSKAVTPENEVIWQGEYINMDPSGIKSGLGKIDYAQDKILIRQTGDHIIAAVDRNGLVVFNNLHIGVSKTHPVDLERLAAYLNSEEMRFYYQAVTLEKERPMAQIDLETLRELPLPESFQLK